MFESAQDQPVDTGGSPKISRAGRKLQDKIAARKREDRRKLLIGAGVVAAFIAIVVGVIAWQQAGETTLVVEWPLEERAGAEVDGRTVSLGKQSRLRFSGPPGQRTLKLSRDGYESIEDSLELGRGETETFRPAWKPTAETARQQQLAALTQRVNTFRKASRGVHPPGPDGGDKPRRSPDDAEVVALRKELVEFRANNFGKPESIGAARQMSRLPWPVDRLRRDDIDPYESWMAGAVDPAGGDNKDPRHGSRIPEVVAVLGDSRLKHSGKISGLEFIRAGELLVSFGFDHAITRVWDPKSGKQLRSAVIPAYSKPSVSGNGKLVAVGSSVDISSSILWTAANCGGVGPVVRELLDRFAVGPSVVTAVRLWVVLLAVKSSCGTPRPVSGRRHRPHSRRGSRRSTSVPTARLWPRA